MYGAIYLKKYTDDDLCEKSLTILWYFISEKYLKFAISNSEKTYFDL